MNIFRIYFVSASLTLVAVALHFWYCNSGKVNSTPRHNFPDRWNKFKYVNMHVKQTHLGKHRQHWGTSWFSGRLLTYVKHGCGRVLCVLPRRVLCCAFICLAVRNGILLRLYAFTRTHNKTLSSYSYVNHCRIFLEQNDNFILLLAVRFHSSSSW